MFYVKYGPKTMDGWELPFALMGDCARIERAWLMIGPLDTEFGTGRNLVQSANLHFIWSDAGGRLRLAIVILPGDMNLLGGHWSVSGPLDAPLDQVVADMGAYVRERWEILSDSHGVKHLLLRFEGEPGKVAGEMRQCVRGAMSDLFRHEFDRFADPAG